MTDAKRIAEIREYYTVDYPDSNPKNDALFLLAHIDKLEARLAEQETELNEWSRQSCGVAKKRRLFDALLAASREACSLLDQPEDEFTETDNLAVHLALAGRVGPAIKALDETQILETPCPHEARLAKAEAVVCCYRAVDEFRTNKTGNLTQMGLDLEAADKAYDALVASEAVGGVRSRLECVLAIYFGQ